MKCEVLEYVGVPPKGLWLVIMEMLRKKKNLITIPGLFRSKVWALFLFVVVCWFYLLFGFLLLLLIIWNRGYIRVIENIVR